MSFTLRKSAILRGKKTFQDVFDHGEQFEGTHLRCLMKMSPGEGVKERPRIKVGFAVSRGIKRAVDRNRIKRLMRESYRLNQHVVPFTVMNSTKCADIVFVYSPRSPLEVRSISFKDVESSVKQILSKIAAAWLT